MERASSKDFPVHFNGAYIVTTVTNEPWRIETVVAELRASLSATPVREYQYGRPDVDVDRNVGLDVKYKCDSRDNDVAILQLCHENRCLIIQLSYLDSVPNALKRFFQDTTINFVCVGIEQVTSKLERDYGLRCSNIVELGFLFSRMKVRGIHHFSNFELAELTAEILGVVIVKPEYIAQSDWGVRVLTSEQVKYATMDASASFASVKTLSTKNDYAYVMTRLLKWRYK